MTQERSQSPCQSEASKDSDAKAHGHHGATVSGAPQNWMQVIDTKEGVMGLFQVPVVQTHRVKNHCLHSPQVL